MCPPPMRSVRSAGGQHCLKEFVMPIDLGAPLTWTKGDSDALRMLQNLQGNILKGHGRDFVSVILFRLDPGRQLESRRMLRELANYHLTSAYRQLIDAERFKRNGEGGGAFAHLALAYKGYEALQMTSCAPTDEDFRSGMKSDESLSALKDPPVHEWETPFWESIHGVVVAAHEIEEESKILAATIKSLIETRGGTVIHIQGGSVLRNAAGEGIEHFGYVDGRSQPLFLQEDIDSERSAGGTSRWDPAFPLGSVLVKDPGTTDAVSFGSYLVFRKLEQRVRDFKYREQAIADKLGLVGDDRELAGALIVGRFEDGTPVTLSNVPRRLRPPNDFNYSGDPGSRCPFHAHIRKVNARGTGGAELESEERGHLMPRRGIAYEDVRRQTHPDALPDAGSLAEFNRTVAPLLPNHGVGLLFMAYNARIARQFKFTQVSWANNPEFPLQPAGRHGLDPLIGQGTSVSDDQKIPMEWDNPLASRNSDVAFSGFVKMKGGEYFYSPSLTWLRDL